MVSPNVPVLPSIRPRVSAPVSRFPSVPRTPEMAIDFFQASPTGTVFMARRSAIVTSALTRLLWERPEPSLKTTPVVGTLSEVSQSMITLLPPA